MLDVFFTIDVEVWCGGWDDLDRRFASAFRRYIYGPTRYGNYGLPRHLDLLSSHGLQGVFFVEPLFATRFDPSSLCEIVDLIRRRDHEVQLHLHTEWVDEALRPLLNGVTCKRQYLRQFSLEEQTALITEGKRLLVQAGAPAPAAFRAGSFALNYDTIRALAAAGIRIDSSYNASVLGPDSGLLPGTLVLEPILVDEVYEYPITVFQDGMDRLRHAQISACSYGELETVLWQALTEGRKATVLLSHSFELLNKSRTRPDWIAARRLEKLCAFLDRHRDCFRVRGFQHLEPQAVTAQPQPLASSSWRTIGRFAEQLYRVAYR